MSLKKPLREAIQKELSDDQRDNPVYGGIANKLLREEFRRHDVSEFLIEQLQRISYRLDIHPDVEISRPTRVTSVAVENGFLVDTAGLAAQLGIGSSLISTATFKDCTRVRIRGGDPLPLESVTDALRLVGYQGKIWDYRTSSTRVRLQN